MRLRFCLSLLLLSSFFFSAIAQEEQKLNGPIAEGAYRSVEDFYQGKALRLRGINFSFDEGANYLIVRPQLPLPELDSLWAWYIDGELFLRVKEDLKLEGDPLFTYVPKLQRISPFYYPSWKKEELSMAIFNPYTGKRIGQRSVENLVRIEKKAFLNLNDGRAYPLEAKYLRQAVQGDVGLQKSVSELSDEELEARFEKIIAIYNDRNPLQ